MCHRVAQQHRLRLGKFTVIEHEHEFATVGVEALNRVWDPARKKPKIVFFHGGDKKLAILLDRRNPRCPQNDYGPFAGGVAMLTPEPSTGQAHVYTRQGSGDG